MTDAGVGTTLPMDNFTYRYETSTSGTFTTNPTTLNRLAIVSDAVSADAYSGDVETGQLNTGNYFYNANGQLIKDVQEQIQTIEWTVTGKVKNIKFSDGAGKKDLKFIYDPMDRRIAKVVYNNPAHTDITYTYYTYDAGGNVMATYQRDIAVNPGVTNGILDKYYLLDHHLYGSSRIGTETEKKQLLSSRSYTITGDAETGTGAVYGTSTQQAYEYTYRRVGDKNYELANHLGNVLAVVTDRKLKLTTTAYTADVISYADYSPYGMLLQHRHGNDNSYRYGFQGQEKDDEVKGTGNSLNYEYRMHDPRVGRFFAVDPLAAKYPWYTPYQFSGNKVIQFVELEGLEEGKPNVHYYNMVPETVGAFTTYTPVWYKSIYGVVNVRSDNAEFVNTSTGKITPIQKSSDLRVEDGVKGIWSTYSTTNVYTYWTNGTIDRQVIKSRERLYLTRSSYVGPQNPFSVKLKVEGSVGVQAGVNTNMGPIKAKAEVSLVEAELGKVEYDVMQNEFSGSHMFNGDGQGVKVKQSLDFSLALVDKRLDAGALGFSAEHSWYALNSGYKNYSSESGAWLGVQLYKHSSGNDIYKSSGENFVWGKRPNLKTKGFSLEFGAKFILGVKIGVDFSMPD